MGLFYLLIRLCHDLGDEYLIVWTDSLHNGEPPGYDGENAEIIYHALGVFA
jgi:hypothetical protein